MANKPPLIAGGKPGMDATKGPAPKQPFAKRPASTKIKRPLGSKR